MDNCLICGREIRRIYSWKEFAAVIADLMEGGEYGKV